MNAQDIREFSAYLRACTDEQVRGVYIREHTAGREDYAELARNEAMARGIALEP